MTSVLAHGQKNLYSTVRLPFIYFVFMIALQSETGCSGDKEQSGGFSDTLRTEALTELRTNLRSLEKWEKVHAAEYLIWSGYPDGVRDEFLMEAHRFASTSPYRIGIWRVLAQCAATPGERDGYIQKITDAFTDPHGPDRLHASETLAKLRIPVLLVAPETTNEILAGEKNSLFLYTLWATSRDTAFYAKNKMDFIDLACDTGADGVMRLQAAYALRNLGGLSGEQWKQLATAALAVPETSVAGAYLTAAAVVTVPDELQSSTLHIQVLDKLKKGKNSALKGARMELAHTLAETGSRDDIPTLLSMLHNENPLNGRDAAQQSDNPEDADVRSAASYALLMIDKRMKGRGL